MPSSPNIRRMDLATDLDAVAGLVYDTDAYLFPFLFGPRSHALPQLRKLIALEANSFSHRHIWCAGEPGAVQGILIGYDHRQFDKAAEEADYQRALALIDRWLLGPRLWVLRPFLDKSDVLGRYIQNVCVQPSFRGRGVGSGLIRHFLELGRDDVWLDVELGNAEAIQLYQRLGFKPEREIPIFLPGLGSLRMVCRTFQL